MTLAVMLAAHDPATLESLSSKGLVRRATKQAQATDVTIEAIDAENATVISEGHTISIDASGPTKASCTCPAAGVCRHILTTVLLLRDHSPVAITVSDVAPSDEKSTPQTTALETLSQLSVEQLKKFAGADWVEATQLAIKLALEEKKPQISTQGLNSVVVLEEGLCSVTFIAGLSLKEVVFKGPKTKKRFFTAVCVLVLRQSIGITIDAVDTPAEVKVLSNDYLVKVQSALESVANIVLSGAADIAADKLFDLAISARVQVAPRLSSQLRSLSKMALQAKDHSIEFYANDFLVLLARTYALVRALQAASNKAKLTGSLRREYVVSEPLTLWVLGAKHWTMPSGARGVTAYAYSEDQQAWYSSTIARAAGMHLAFDPYLAYEEALWGAYSMSGLVGKCVQLKQPRISSDQQIAPAQELGVLEKTQVLDSYFHQNSSCIVDEWGVLYANIQERFGQGLTRGVLPVAQLLKPKKFGALTFDEFLQNYYWELFDVNGRTIQLEMPADFSHQIDEIRLLEKRIEAVLVEAVLFNDELHFKPVSLLVKEKNELQVLNMHFHRLWNYRQFDRLLKRFKDKVLPAKKPEIKIEDPLSILANTCIDLIVDLIAYPHGSYEDLRALGRRCDVSGLASLAKAMHALEGDRRPEQLLAAVYIASEVLIVSGFR